LRRRRSGSTSLCVRFPKNGRERLALTRCLAPAESLRENGRLVYQRKTGYSSAYGLASSYAELGDNEHAFEWLNTAFQEHEEYLLGLKTDLSMDPIRSDPRFAELVRKVGLPQ